MVNIERYLLLFGASIVIVFTVEYCLRHRHKWHVRAVDHGVMSEPRRNATAILYVCVSCGVVKSTTIAGTFQLEDIRGSLCGGFQPEHRDPGRICWSTGDKEFAKTLKITL